MHFKNSHVQVRLIYMLPLYSFLHSSHQGEYKFNFLDFAFNVYLFFYKHTNMLTYEVITITEVQVTRNASQV